MKIKGINKGVDDIAFEYCNYSYIVPYFSKLSSVSKVCFLYIRNAVIAIGKTIIKQSLMYSSTKSEVPKICTYPVLI